MCYKLTTLYSRLRTMLCAVPRRREKQPQTRNESSHWFLVLQRTAHIECTNSFALHRIKLHERNRKKINKTKKVYPQRTHLLRSTLWCSFFSLAALLTFASLLSLRIYAVKAEISRRAPFRFSKYRAAFVSICRVSFGSAWTEYEKVPWRERVRYVFGY